MLGDYLPDGYYAVEDPDGPDEPGGDAMTLWRVVRGEVWPYPKSAPYGPRLHRKDAPADPEERYAWRAAGMDYWRAWKARVVDVLRADPVSAQFRFGEHTARCCICGRVLTGGTSRMLGVGPDCRDALPDGLLKAFLQMRSEARDAD
jgi:hypothetical protein